MEAVFGRIFGASPRQLATSVSPDHRAVSSSVSQHGSKRYWSLFVGLQETETTYLAVESRIYLQNSSSPTSCMQELVSTRRPNVSKVLTCIYQFAEE